MFDARSRPVLSAGPLHALTGNAGAAPGSGCRRAPTSRRRAPEG
ncbi:hypothetical protein DB32_003875 [Sandaracinus amylolyticus]|uniref:Uncharacterized protein n=1 Tax=Sandaracinus amylolyticus TaxID=927083 RepID=A0A0F6YII7_9BACT|nr:hypothetical protein DB32_003875 [Sandaracinus amylolyticus]